MRGRRGAGRQSSREGPGRAGSAEPEGGALRGGAAEGRGGLHRALQPVGTSSQGGRLPWGGGWPPSRCGLREVTVPASLSLSFPETPTSREAVKSQAARTFPSSKAGKLRPGGWAVLLACGLQVRAQGAGMLPRSVPAPWVPRPLCLGLSKLAWGKVGTTMFLSL